MVTTLVVILKMPETRGISLETIEEQYNKEKSQESTPNASRLWKKELQPQLAAMRTEQV